MQIKFSNFEKLHYIPTYNETASTLIPIPNFFPQKLRIGTSRHLKEWKISIQKCEEQRCNNLFEVEARFYPTITRLEEKRGVAEGAVLLQQPPGMGPNQSGIILAR